MGEDGLAGLAESWVSHVVRRSRSHDLDALARTRRDDLCRWAAAWTGTGPPYEFSRQLRELGHEVLTPAAVEKVTERLRLRYAPTTTVRTLSSLRGFTRWLVRQGELLEDPFETAEVVVPVVRAEGEIDPVFALSTEQVETLRHEASRAAPRLRSAWPVRDVAIIEVLSGCGLRASELAAMQRRDVDERGEYPVLRVVRAVKGRQRRQVPVPRHVAVALSAWDLERVRVLGEVGADAPLFVRTNGKAIDRLFLYRLVEQLCARCSVPLAGDAVVHAFRHHYGVELARRGLPLSVLQELLGHQDPRTTSVYTQMAAHHLTAALDDAGWL